MAIGNIKVICGLIILLSCSLYYHIKRKQRFSKLPPGPKPLPIVGNILDLPPAGGLEHLHWLKHRDLYGPITSITVLGQSIVILHEAEVAHEILGRNSLKTSARPTTEFLSKVCDYRGNTFIMSYDATTRQFRKLMHEQLGTKPRVARFQSIQEAEVGRFLYQLLRRPKDHFQHLKSQMAANILQMTYGYSIELENPDPLVQLIEYGIETNLEAINGKWIVNFVPILRHWPEWLPGGGFKSKARKYSNAWRDVVEIPYQFVRHEMRNGTSRLSYVSKLIEDGFLEVQSSKGFVEEPAIKGTAANMYLAAVEATSSTLSFFFLAMVKFPEVQRRAQEELDRVVGPCKLPTPEDRDRLPYIEGVLKETLRWLSAVPMGLPHMAEDDIYYNDYLIPKGAILFAAPYEVTHDPTVYLNPESYDPERYLEPRNEPDPAPVLFGFGRRVCPGRYFADTTLFLNIAQTLSMFRITKTVDENGSEVDPEVKIESGLTHRPESFPLNITPRSSAHADVVMNLKMVHNWEEGDADRLKNPSCRHTKTAL